MDSVASAPRLVALKSLGRAEPWRFAYQPEPEVLAEIRARLGLLALRKTRLTGRLVPLERRDWRLEAELGATAVQPCSVSLAPVTTRVDAPLVRLYEADYEDVTENEAESPEDDSREPLPAKLDLGELFAEALALALPDFPRAAEADFVDLQAAPPGAAPLAETKENPFQALAALKPEPKT